MQNFFNGYRFDVRGWEGVCGPLSLEGESPAEWFCVNRFQLSPAARQEAFRSSFLFSPPLPEGDDFENETESLVRLTEIQRLYDYNSWANERVLESLRLVGQDDFAGNRQASHGSIRGVLAHIAAAEWIWLERWKGLSPVALLPESEFETVEFATQRLRGIDRSLMDFTSQLTQADLDVRLEYKTTEGRVYSNVLSDMLLHLVNHSSYHRGQITTLLRQSGGCPAVD